MALVDDDDLDLDYGDELLDLQGPIPKRLRLIIDEELSGGKRSGDICTATSTVDGDESRNTVSFLRHKKLKLKALLDTFPVTGFCGYTVHLNFKRADDVETLSVTGKEICSLLGTPFEVLLDQLAEAREYGHLEGSTVQSSTFEEPSLLTKGIDENDSSTILKPNDAELQLWVEKYKPSYFLELLSDDGINRTLLRWLKLWDKVVFGREVKVRTKLKNDQQNIQQKKKFTPKLELNEELDNFSRPFYKVALLSGPPGLGKTTLAYIIAQHAGYNVVEMNASDDRSAEMFKQNLESATQMRAVMGQSPKPNCLIIDEIDGAPAPAINVLVSYIKSTGAIKGKKGKQPILLRPVICICNDLYVPALRPLKQLALTLNFPATASSRLASRLMNIMRKENMKTDMTTLLALCEKAENDIRSCLATLQFLHSTKEEMKLRDVQAASIGQKDSQKSMFFVWQHIFQIPQNSRKFIDLVKDEDSTSRNCTEVNARNPEWRMKNILQLVLSCGEYDKLIRGLFENYLAIKFKDPRLDLVNNGVEWLCFSDLVQHEINHTQLYTLMSYLPYVAVSFHFLFAVLSPPKLAYPSMHNEMRTKQTQLLSIVTSVFIDLQLSTRSYLDSSVLALQIFPYLFYIIQPTVRPVNTQLYSDKERANLQNVINTMSSYSLVYRQERSPEGQYSYVLEPNIEEVIQFTGIKPTCTLSYGAKQLIARELEVEKMRQSEKKSGPEVTASVVKAEPSIPNHKQQTLVPKAVKDFQPTRDFFGRKIEKTCNLTSESHNDSAGGNVWYHFKEGYSNAVRRTVYIKDLLS